MSLKKDKKKVLGESFSDERIRTFLHITPYAGMSRDYCALERAYRSMIAENFATFVRFFTDEGMDINATNLEGETFMQAISSHRNAEEYLEALKAAGAR